MTRRKVIILAAIVAVIAIGSMAYFFMVPSKETIFNDLFFSKEVSTPYGEQLKININIGGEAIKGSWKASISDSASDDLYNVSGSTIQGSFNSIADSKLITISVAVSISGSNVENVQIVELYIKTVDVSDSSNHIYYSVQSTSPLSISLPYSNTFYPLNSYSISTMLTDTGASTTSAEIKFYVYMKVTATGAISGNPIVAEITETQFADLNFVYQTEQNSATVDPSVSVASWTELGAQIFVNVTSGVLVAVITFYILYHRRKGR